MANVKITCPACGFTREMPAEKIPDRPLRVTCPKCRESFGFRRPVGSPVEPPREEAPAPPSPSGPGPAARSAVPSRPRGMIPPPPPPRPELRGVAELFRDSWEIYHQRVGPLMGLYLVAIAFLLLPPGVFTLLGLLGGLALPELRAPLVAAGVATGAVVGLLAMFWGLAALTFAVVEERLGIREALARGWERAWGFVWVVSLVGFIVTGGFLLLVVPGILFAVWFSLAQFVFVAEGEGGMRALLKSRAYMQGRSLDVFLRLLAVWGVSVLLGMIPLAGGLLSLLFVPYMMIFICLIYRDLREVRGEPAFVCSGGEKAKWILLGALGYVLLPAVLISLLGASIVAALLQALPVF